ncbi:MAG: CBS domain-containing protein [Methylotenera sp.]|nr:CBS domain-containing protein [Oligoflexia bacterium]
METTAKEIMSTEMLNATEGMTIEEALKLLINSRITGLPVVDAEGKMIGVLSEYDILMQISQAKNMKPEVFQQVITFSRKADTIAENMPLNDIVKRFIDSKYRRLPVVNKAGKLIGIITRRDLMRVFYYRARLS